MSGIRTSVDQIGDADKPYDTTILNYLTKIVNSKHKMKKVCYLLAFFIKIYVKNYGHVTKMVL